MAVEITLTGVKKLRYLDSGLQEPDFERALKKDRTRYLIVAVEPVEDIIDRDNKDEDEQGRLTTKLRISAIEPAIVEVDEEILIKQMGEMNRARTYAFREHEHAEKERRAGRDPGQEAMDI